MSPDQMVTLARGYERLALRCLLRGGARWGRDQANAFRGIARDLRQRALDEAWDYYPGSRARPSVCTSSRFAA